MTVTFQQQPHQRQQQPSLANRHNSTDSNNNNSSLIKNYLSIPLLNCPSGWKVERLTGQPVLKVKSPNLLSQRPPCSSVLKPCSWKKWRPEVSSSNSRRWNEDHENDILPRRLASLTRLRVRTMKVGQPWKTINDCILVNGERVDRRMTLSTKIQVARQTALSLKSALQLLVITPKLFKLV